MTTATALPTFLEGKTHVTVRSHGQQVWFDETRAGSTLADAVHDLDGLKAVLLLEGGTVKDVSAEAARLWYEINRDEVETVFDIPDFIHGQPDVHNEIYSDICERRYEARAYVSHINSLGGRL